MKTFLGRAIVAAMLVTSGVSVGAAPPKPPKPTPPAPPANPNPGGDYVKCVASGVSVQICAANYPG